MTPPPHGPELGRMSRLLGRFHVTGVFWFRFHRWGVSILPEWGVWLITLLFTSFFFVVLRRIRRAIARNLEAVLGPCGWWLRQRRIYRTMWSFAWCLSERYERLSTPRRVSPIPPIGEEHWQRALASPEGLVLVTTTVPEPGALGLAVPGDDAGHVDGVRRQRRVEQPLKPGEALRHVLAHVRETRAAAHLDLGAEADHLGGPVDLDLLLVELLGKGEGDHLDRMIDHPDAAALARIADTRLRGLLAAAHGAQLVLLARGEVEARCVGIGQEGLVVLGLGVPDPAVDVVREVDLVLEVEPPRLAGDDGPVEQDDQRVVVDPVVDDPAPAADVVADEGHGPAVLGHGGQPGEGVQVELHGLRAGLPAEEAQAHPEASLEQVLVAAGLGQVRGDVRVLDVDRRLAAAPRPPPFVAVRGPVQAQPGLRIGVGGVEALQPDLLQPLGVVVESEPAEAPGLHVHPQDPVSRDLQSGEDPGVGDGEVHPSHSNGRQAEQHPHAQVHDRGRQRHALDAGRGQRHEQQDRTDHEEPRCV